MSKCRIFVSSTCFDLAAVREDLRGHIKSLGHEPVLSEYASFPIDPDRDTITNCRKNVREHSDLVVLVVGGARGYLEPQSQKSVTNLEYDTAREERLPVFVFVKKSVQTLLSVWRKNPDADFTPHVDDPAVFAFIERIYAENKWVYTFERTGDISDTLTTQLSYFLRMLIAQRREGKLKPFAEFFSISEKAEEIAREKPPYWEYLLIAEIWETLVMDVRYRSDRIKAGVCLVPSAFHEPWDFLDKMQEVFHDFQTWAPSTEVQMRRVMKATGPLGQPGDALEIKRSVIDMVALVNRVVDWQERLQSYRVHPELEYLKILFTDYCSEIFKSYEEFPQKIRAIIEPKPKSGSYHIEIQLPLAPTEKYNAELARLRPWLLTRKQNGLCP